MHVTMGVRFNFGAEGARIANFYGFRDFNGKMTAEGATPKTSDDEVVRPQSGPTTKWSDSKFVSRTPSASDDFVVGPLRGRTPSASAPSALIS